MGEAGRRRPRAVFLRHHAEDDPGFVGAALARRGFDVEILDVVDGTSIDLDGVEVLVILGSTHSVTDRERTRPWLDAELDAIRAAERAGTAVLGICFGAQALCAAVGGRVERAPRRELGWVPLDGAPVAGIPEGPWFQFHDDRCLPPDDATVLARNDVCVQAFRVGRHLGVQFHPELDAAQLARWVKAGADAELAAAGIDPDVLIAQTESLEGSAAERVDRLVGAFLEQAA